MNRVYWMWGFDLRNLRCIFVVYIFQYLKTYKSYILPVLFQDWTYSPVTHGWCTAEGSTLTQSQTWAKSSAVDAAADWRAERCTRDRNLGIAALDCTWQQKYTLSQHRSDDDGVTAREDSGLFLRLWDWSGQAWPRCVHSPHALCF